MVRYILSSIKLLILLLIISGQGFGGQNSGAMVELDLYTEYPSNITNAGINSLSSIGPDTDVFVKIYLKDVSNLVLYQVDLLVDPDRIEWVKILGTVDASTDNPTTDEKNILIKENQFFEILSVYNSVPGNENGKFRKITVGAALDAIKIGVPDSYAADGDGLAGLIQLRTTSSFSVNDEAKIYIKRAVFSDNSYPNRVEEYSIQSYSVGGRINPDDSPKETGELIEDIIKSNTDTITAEYGDGTKINLNFTSGSGFAGNTVTINALGDSLPDSLASDEGFMKISEKAAAYFLIETDIDTSVNPFTADLSFTYTTENLFSAGIIEGSAEESRLVMAFFNENNVWQKVETVIDTNSNTVSAEVSHFSSWAIVDSSDSDLVPVELSVFTGQIDEYEGIILEWSTVSESNNYGFYIEKSTDNIIFTEIGFVRGAGTSFNKNTYSYIDMDSNEAGDYYYRLRQTDNNGDYTYSGIVKVTIQPPGDYELFPAYPNPFNPTASIEYSLKESGFVKLTVYNTLGQEVARLVNENMAAGKHKVLFNAENFASGMYIYKITVNGFTSAGKIVLMK